MEASRGGGEERRKVASHVAEWSSAQNKEGKRGVGAASWWKLRGKASFT